jgi:dipeptidase D
MLAVTDPFAGLEPAAFWRHFAALTRIPRATHDEEHAVAHVLAWAGDRGLGIRRDAAGNLVVEVPATAGREGAPTVVLQGHLDMVCERDPDSPYDPRAGRIGVLRDGEWLRADGTTLGADNGVAIAAMLALVEDPGVVHGPLELLMTVSEEIGLAGAVALDPELIRGTVLLNLDSEEDAALTVGCAGSIDSVLRLEAPRAPVEEGESVLHVTVSGGLGGHSGGDIALGRANAIKVLGRVLAGTRGVRIAALDGGASRNAIPRAATAIVVVATPQARHDIEAEGAQVSQAFSTTDPGVRVGVEPAAERANGAWTTEASARILDLIATLPAGPLGMSAHFPGTVETSSSVGVAATEGDGLTLRCLSRSANDAVLPDVTGAIGAAARLAGAEVAWEAPSYAWRPDLSSPALATAKTVHERLFGVPPEILLTHGGLETAVFGGKRPGLDMLSFGPRIEGAHAPGERLHIESSGRFMRLLAGLVDELGRPRT